MRRGDGITITESLVVIGECAKKTVIQVNQAPLSCEAVTASPSGPPPHSFLGKQDTSLSILEGSVEMDVKGPGKSSTFIVMTPNTSGAPTPDSLRSRGPNTPGTQAPDSLRSIDESGAFSMKFGTSQLQEPLHPQSPRATRAQVASPRRIRLQEPQSKDDERLPH